MSPIHLGSRLTRAFEDTGAKLLEVHGELAKLVAKAASDPWGEHLNQTRIAELQAKRDELMLTHARQMLSWRLQGGRVELTHKTEALTPATPQNEPAEDAAEQAERPKVFHRRRTTSDHREDGENRTGGSHIKLDGAQIEPLIATLRMLEEPTTPIDSMERVRQELESLTAGTTNTRLDTWTSFPKLVQKALVGMVVARARHLQDEVHDSLIPSGLSGDLDRVFSTMTGFSKREQPGFVFGLQRHHHPMGLTWLADARRWWNDLIDALPNSSVMNPKSALAELKRRVSAELGEEEIKKQLVVVIEAGVEPNEPRLLTMCLGLEEMIRKTGKLKPLREPLSNFKKVLDDSETSYSDAALPEDFDCADDLSGLNVLLVGGEHVPDETIKRMEELFDFNTISRPPTGTRLQMEDRGREIMNGNYDLVIVLTCFVGGKDHYHHVDTACREMEIPLTDLDPSRGYEFEELLYAVELSFEEEGEEDE